MSESHWKYLAAIPAAVLVIAAGYFLADVFFGSLSYSKEMAMVASSTDEQTATAAASGEEVRTTTPVWPLPLDTAEYDRRLLELVNYIPPQPVVTTGTTTNSAGEVVVTRSTSTPASPLVYSSDTNVTIEGQTWPKAQPYPNGGAILPFHRILAYYGNFYSTRMGILGEFEPEVVIEKLLAEKAKWEAADPDTPVMPAIEYIAMVAQADAGADGMYRNVMPDTHMQKALDMAREIDGIMIFDLQIGLSNLKAELPQFTKWLQEPDVHLALDPEFAMHNGNAPGTVIGSFDATDINFAINFMSEIVREKQLPPKVLIVHRFTQNMVTNAHLIKSTPEVQVIMVMDGWGSPSLKTGTYSQVIVPEPVQFAGVKIFYKNDLKPPSTRIWTPADVLGLDPKPVFVQYQ